MLNELNLVILEGTIVYDTEIKEVADKKVMNFVMENVRQSKHGEQRFRYNCVLWDKQIEKYGHKMKQKEFVRVTGHLQDGVVKLEGGGDFHFSKVCVDHVDFDE